MSLITNDKKQLSTINTEDTYKEIRCFIISAKQEIYKSVNSAMVEAYWNIGKKIYEVCGENDRAWKTSIKKYFQSSYKRIRSRIQCSEFEKYETVLHEILKVLHTV